MLNFETMAYVPRIYDLYFHINDTQKKCFIEEIPDETTVFVRYKIEPFDPRTNGFMPSQPGVGMHVEVKDPNNATVLSRVYSAEGRISFISQTPGEHVLCLHSNSTKWIGSSPLRIHFDIKVGDQAIDYAIVAQKEKLSELQLRIRQLLDQIDQIIKEQNYQRYREENFRATSESTSKLLFSWSISQVIILVSMGLWQIQHLKKFFEAKQLIKLDKVDEIIHEENKRSNFY